MAKDEKPRAVPGEPGSDEWEANQKVLKGEVEPGTGDLEAANPTDAAIAASTDEDDDK